MSNTRSTGPAARPRIASFWPIFLGLVLVLGFFLAHQTWNTGFFTTSFGPVEMTLFYCAVLLGLAITIFPQYLSRKAGLVSSILVATFWTIAAGWLLLTFPFNFTQTTAVVPGPLRFLLNWVSNDVGRILVWVSLVGAAAFIPFFALQYTHLNRQSISETLH